MAQFILSIQMYLQYESLTSLTLKQRDQLIMPAVTICNSNGLRRSVIEGIDPDMILPFEQFMDITYGVRTNKTISRTESMKNYTFYQFLNLAGHRKQDFFVWCSFGQTVINCTDYITDIRTNAGHCYTFNSDESITRNGQLIMSEPGPYDGLQIILDIEPDEYIVSNGFGEGIRFHIHEPGIMPIINTGSYFAGPGQEVYFSLTETHTTYLQPPYSELECVPEAELSQRGNELGLDAPYSEEGCLNECYQHAVYDCPHCSANAIGKPQCDLYDSIQCAANNGVTNQNKRSCNCPRKCQTISFSGTNSHTNIPSNFILRLAQNYNWTVKERAEIQRRFILIRIFFDTNTTTNIVEKPLMTLIETLANIGGTFGLYLGASILTVTEIFEFGIVYLAHRLLGRNRSTNTDEKTPHPVVSSTFSSIILEHPKQRDTIRISYQDSMCQDTMGVNRNTTCTTNQPREALTSRYSTAQDYNNLKSFENNLYDLV